MVPDSVLDILKTSILLETRGRALYAKIAEQAASQAVKDFFGMMADDEDKHLAVLSEQLKAYSVRGSFSPQSDGDDSAVNFASVILSDRIKREISSAEFEAAAIAAALTMERDAVHFYSLRAEAAEDPEEKALYRWLSDWEKGHLDFLSRLERELTEAVWNDSGFWPF